MTEYTQFVLQNLQKELDNIEYKKQLRRRRNEHEVHQPVFNSNCPSCRAAYWHKKLNDIASKEEIKEELNSFGRYTIGLTNVVKTEPANP